MVEWQETQNLCLPLPFEVEGVPGDACVPENQTPWAAVCLGRTIQRASYKSWWIIAKNTSSQLRPASSNFVQLRLSFVSGSSELSL